MPNRSMFINRLGNSSSRLVVTPTQIRVTIAKGDRNERAVQEAAKLIADQIDLPINMRGTFRNLQDGSVDIHMTTRSNRNHIPGKRFVYRNGVLEQLAKAAA
ncbi:hypothetical protein GS982_01645 [Rhodococcus hoagii]|uniref:Uncharacterized protein n=1 Tax=Rhodococcus hoagii TaxID=43767 RepID=A0A9Q4ZIR8_RHOHA|nr:hypothetical protein [Prescottella equi]MBM4708674.1 hypothetical protein [Prescottella equi]NKT77301.1 hypothetical protein [Prescottella equi]NKZ81088.1 hypothetical protein [Prescottella equi]